MPEPVVYCFTVAIAGDGRGFPESYLPRLIDLLVNRYRGDRRIVLMGTADGPELLPWAHDRGWSVHLGPGDRNPVKRDCELIAWADALLVLGPPGPWARLLALAREAGIPVRVYETCPRLPLKADRLDWPAEG